MSAVTISRWTWSAGRLLLIVPLLALALVGCNSGDECDTCSTDLDCEAGFFCSTFSDDSRRCGSGEGATSCSVR